MRLHEFEAMDIFESFGIPVPRRAVAESVEEALRVAGEIGYPVVVKAQVLVGGRGLAGGIRRASNEKELEETAGALLGSEIRGLTVRKILVAEEVEISRELYLGITIDGYWGRPVVVAGTQGGIHIEERAKEMPDQMVSMHIDPSVGCLPYQARRLLRKLNMDQQLLVAWADVISRLYGLFSRFEAVIAEINPLVVLPNGSLVAVDAVLELDDSALRRINYPLPRPPERVEHPLERRGREIGVTYIELDGDIGVISSGAGLGMASVDLIAQRMRPANFLETGGGITEDLLYQCMGLVMMKANLRGILINIYGGINPIHEGAKGVARYLREHDVRIPIVAKALGNHQEETWEILRSAGVNVVTEVSTEKAVERLFELVGEGGQRET